MSLIEIWKGWAKRLKTETYTLYLAYKDPRMPWYAKVWAACILGYAFSPIDLIPDFIPLIGYLDDLILLPLGIALAIRLIPAQVLTDCRKRAQIEIEADHPVNRSAAIVIITVWLITSVIIVFIVLKICVTCSLCLKWVK